MSERKTADYIASAVFSAIFMVAVNAAPFWRPYTQGVVLESWSSVLWALNVSSAAQIAGNLLLAFLRPAWLDELLRGVFAALGLLTVIVFFIIFPLDFSRLVGPWLNSLLKVVLGVGIGGCVIGVVVQLVKFIRAAARPFSAVS